MLSARADMVPKTPRDFGFIDSLVLYTTSLKARRQSHQGALCLEGEQGTDDCYCVASTVGFLLKWIHLPPS